MSALSRLLAILKNEVDGLHCQSMVDSMRAEKAREEDGLQEDVVFQRQLALVKAGASYAEIKAHGVIGDSQPDYFQKANRQAQQKQQAQSQSNTETPLPNEDEQTTQDQPSQEQASRQEEGGSDDNEASLNEQAQNPAPSFARQKLSELGAWAWNDTSPKQKSVAVAVLAGVLAWNSGLNPFHGADDKEGQETNPETVSGVSLYERAETSVVSAIKNIFSSEPIESIGLVGDDAVEDVVLIPASESIAQATPSEVAVSTPQQPVAEPEPAAAPATLNNLQFGAFSAELNANARLQSLGAAFKDDDFEIRKSGDNFVVRLYDTPKTCDDFAEHGDCANAPKESEMPEGGRSANLLVQNIGQEPVGDPLAKYARGADPERQDKNVASEPVRNGAVDDGPLAEFRRDKKIIVVASEQPLPASLRESKIAPSGVVLQFGKSTPQELSAALMQAGVDNFVADVMEPGNIQVLSFAFSDCSQKPQTSSWQQVGCFNAVGVEYWPPQIQSPQ